MSLFKKVSNLANHKWIRKKLGLTGKKIKTRLGLRYRGNFSSAAGYSNVGSTGFRRYV